MPNNPLTQEELYDYGILRSITPPNEVVGALSPPYFPPGYFLVPPHDVNGIVAWRKFHAGYISEGIIDPERLGTGYVGDGNLYLADDGTWKAVSGGGGGAVDRIIAGTNISISPIGGTGDVTINATTLNPDPTGYGSFYSTQNQSLAAIDTPQIVTFNNTYEANDVSLSSNRIYFAKAGTYQFAYVAQIFNSSNDIEHCEFWIKYNGVDFPNSATHITIQARKSASEPSEQQMKLILSGTAQNDGDYIELYWQGSTTNLQLGYVAPGVDGPVGSPSVIANIIPIGAQGRDSNLNELNDVLITTPLNGQLLRYDSTDQIWENWTPNFLTTVPTLDQVTTAGNSTTKRIRIFPTTGTKNTELWHDGSGFLIEPVVQNQYLSLGSSGSSKNWPNGIRYFGGDHTFYSDTTTVRATLKTTGNFLIGTTTDAGYKLDVNGTIRTNGIATLAGIIAQRADTNENVIQITQAVGAGAAHLYSLGDGYLGWVGINPSTGRRYAFESTPGSSGRNFGLYIYNSSGLSPVTAFSANYSTFTIGINTSVNGTLKAQLTNATKTNQVYYDSITGELTYDAVSSGGNTFIIDYDYAIVGAKDGVNTNYSTTSSFITGTTRVYLNGVRLTRGVGYDYVELSNTQIQLDYSPVASDRLIIEYEQL